MKEKPRQHFQQHKWYSRYWRSLISMPWLRHTSPPVMAPGDEPALARGQPCSVGGQRARAWSCQPGGCGTPSPLCRLAAPTLESQSAKQTWQNLVLSHNGTIIDSINTQPNKASRALPRWELCLRDTRVAAPPESPSAVVIATGTGVHRHPLHNSQLHLEKCNSLHKASEQQQQPKTHGHG